MDVKLILTRDCDDNLMLWMHDAPLKHTKRGWACDGDNYFVALLCNDAMFPTLAPGTKALVRVTLAEPEVVE